MKLFAFAALLVASASFARNSAPASISVTWSLATGYRAESFHGRNLSQFANDVNAATKGQDVPMVEVGKALKEGRIDSMITSAVTGAENRVWGDIKYYYAINAWFPKNIVYVNAKAFNTLSSAAQKAVLEAAALAEQRGWQMSQIVAADSTEELRANGVKIERIPREIESALKRLGEKFSREWVTAAGQDATAIFTLYYVDGISAAQVAQSPSN